MVISFDNCLLLAFIFIIVIKSNNYSLNLLPSFNIVFLILYYKS